MVPVRGAGCVRFFFDDEISLATQRKTVDALNNEGVQDPLKLVNLDSDIVDKKKPRRFFT
jgi:hypothetical protein